MLNVALLNVVAPPYLERLDQGILKGEVSLYHWPPVQLVWNQLYDIWQYMFLFAVKQEVNNTVILPPLVLPD